MLPPRLKVLLALRAVPHYRLPFLEKLRDHLRDHRVELDLVYGQVGEVRSKKNDTVEVPWGARIHNRIIGLGPLEFYWQPFLDHVRGADLVIVTQEAKLLVNYLLHVWREAGRIRMAYWGHGAGFRRNRLSWMTEWGKRLLARRVDWWFAYTEKSARVLAAAGVSRSRITVVNNAIDTRSLVAARRALSQEELESWRARLGIRSNNVGVFVGGMYKEKRLDFLLEACRRIRGIVADFEVVLVGDGPEADRVRREAELQPWVHYLGPLFGHDKVAPLALGKVLLMPGLVGLAVLDSFAMETPLVTTSVPYHSPEIEYLKEGVNGVVVPTAEGMDGYVEAVTSLISEPGALRRLQEGCRASAMEYSVENMAERFAGGIIAALERT